MNVSVFVGDLTEAQAEALCTSTNPRLSLVAGTGGAVRDRGGWEIKRECEAIVEEFSRRTGRNALPIGSVHATTAGALDSRVILHCVASDRAHRSSAAVIEACVRNALIRAATEHCASVAMPVFGAGHAGFDFARAVRAIGQALVAAPPDAPDVVVVVEDAARAGTVAGILREMGVVLEDAG